MKYLIVVPSFDGGMSIHAVPNDTALLKMVTPDEDGYSYFGKNVHYMSADQVPSQFDDNDMFGKHPNKFGENMVVLIVEVKRVVVPKPKEVVVTYEL